MSYCVFLEGLAVMSVDFGNEFMKIAIVKVSISVSALTLLSRAGTLLPNA